MTKMGWRWAHKLCGKTSSASIPKLPDDVIIDILSRLPVKTLLRLKCVCKSWHIFISSTHFAKLQLKKTHNADDYANHRVIPLTDCDRFRTLMMSFPLSPMSRKSSHKTTSLDYRYNNMKSTVLFVGSYNGLICSVSFNIQQIMLWNPTTGQYNVILVYDSKELCCHFSSYGFYYDENSDDYKVVIINDDFIPYGFEAKLWSSGTNSWKTVQGVLGFRVVSRTAAAVNGKLHWTGRGETNNIHGTANYTIHALDFNTERFANLALPDFYDYGNNGRLPIVAVCKGFLCIVCQFFHSGDEQIGAWVMKEYGVKESWTKVFALPCLRFQRPKLFERYTKRFCITGNNEVIFLRKTEARCLVRAMSQLPFYTASAEFIDDRRLLYFPLPTFIESLVSPRAGNTEPALSQRRATILVED